MRVLAVLAITLAVLLASLQYRLWFGIGGVPMVETLQAQVSAQRQQNAELTLRNEALVAEVHDLKTGDLAIEERARNELGMIKPGEVFYRVIDPDGVLDAAPAADVPR